MNEKDGIKVTVFNPLNGVTPATCGHDDLLGFFMGLPCDACTRAAHKKALGRQAVTPDPQRASQSEIGTGGYLNQVSSKERGIKDVLSSIDRKSKDEKITPYSIGALVDFCLVRKALEIDF